MKDSLSGILMTVGSDVGRVGYLWSFPRVRDLLALATENHSAGPSIVFPANLLL